MRFFQDNGETYIVLDDSEEERTVLRAIVIASFELAQPAGLSAIDYLPDYQLSDTEADQWILSVPRSHDGRIVDMDFVQGRQCKTVLSKEAAGHFTLDTRYFERYRGDCLPVLERARDLITEARASRAEDRTHASRGLRALSATT